MTSTYHETAGRGLATMWELDLGYLTFARFAELLVERGLPHAGSSSWPTEKMTLEGLFDHALSTQRDSGRRTAVLDLGAVLGGECLAHVVLQRGRLVVLAAARDVDVLASVKPWLRERFPVTQPDEAQRVGITFWSMGPYCGQRTERKVDVPSWTQVAGNYPPSVRARLADLASESFEPGAGGRLLLWHGEPGTGKTWALRALGWEWREWCDLHYVTDPRRSSAPAPDTCSTCSSTSPTRARTTSSAGAS